MQDNQINNLPPTEVLKAREAGLLSASAPPVGELPAGSAMWAVPHHLTKVAIINQFARAYRWTYDEALKDSRRNATKMLADLMVRDALKTRIVPTTQLSWHLEPQDPTDPEQLKAVAKLEEIIRATPRLQDLHEAMLMAVWYGRAGVLLRYEWDYSHPDGQRRLVVKNHRPVNGDSLVAHWSGDWGVLVNGMYNGPKVQTEIGFEHFFNEREREAVLIHMNMPEDSDYFEPELAGQIRGSGVRGHCYWYWWLRSNFLALLSDYAERFVSGIKVAGYDKSNPDGKSTMEEALSEYRNDGFILVPKETDGKTPYSIEVHEVGTASPAFMFEMLTYLEGYIKRYITGSSIDEAVGIGGDGAAVYEDRVTRTTKYDANRLAETYSLEWLKVLTKYNCGPKVPPPRWVFDTEASNASEVIGYAERLKSLGADIDLDHLIRTAGLPTTTPGANISNNLDNLAPVAVAQQPQQVPMLTPSSVLPSQQQVQQVQQPIQQQQTVMPTQEVQQ